MSLVRDAIERSSGSPEMKHCLEVERRALLELNGAAQCGTPVNRVGAIEPIANPAGPRFEHDRAQAWEAIEHAILKKRPECLRHARRGEQIEIPVGPVQTVEALMHAPGGRLQCRMNREWDAEILRRREDRVVAAVLPLLVRQKANRAEDSRLLPLVLRSAISFLAIFRRTARARVEARPLRLPGLRRELVSWFIIATGAMKQSYWSPCAPAAICGSIIRAASDIGFPELGW
jgi:hypothetical protein